MAAATTTFDEFTRLLEGRRVVPVVRELFADGETPVGIYRKLADGRPGTFLLESAEQGGIWSRYSFVGVSSYGVITEADDRVEWLDYGLDAERALGDAAELPPLKALEAMFERWRTEDVPGAPPLTGGLVGFIGWEAVRQIEHLPNRPPAESRIPGQAFSFVAELVVIDHRTGTVQLIASVLNDAGEPADSPLAGRAGASRPHAAGPRAAGRGMARRHRPVARRRPASSQRTRRLPRRSRPIQAAHPRRRRVPGRHLAAVRTRGHGESARCVSRAAQPQPEPVHVLRPPRGCRGRAVLDRGLLDRRRSSRCRAAACSRIRSRGRSRGARPPKRTPISRRSSSPTPRSRQST